MSGKWLDQEGNPVDVGTYVIDMYKPPKGHGENRTFLKEFVVTQLKNPGFLDLRGVNVEERFSGTCIKDFLRKDKFLEYKNLEDML